MANRIISRRALCVGAAYLATTPVTLAAEAATAFACTTPQFTINDSFSQGDVEVGRTGQIAPQTTERDPLVSNDEDVRLQRYQLLLRSDAWTREDSIYSGDKLYVGVKFLDGTA